MEITYCSSCGQANAILNKFCYKCGEKLFFSSKFDKPFVELIAEPDISKSENSSSFTKSDSSSQKMSIEDKKNAKNGCLLILGIILVISYFIFNATDNNSDKSGDRVLEDTDIIFSIEYYLKTKYLRDPDSYQYIESSKAVLSGNVQNKYIVDFTFRAKNAFGGYVIEEKIFTLDIEGNVVDMQNFK